MVEICYSDIERLCGASLMVALYGGRELRPGSATTFSYASERVRSDPFFDLKT